MRLAEHPTVRQFQARTAATAGAAALDAAELRRLCLEAGAADVGIVEIDRPALAAERTEILRWFPAARSLVSFVCRLNREPIRSPARSVANLEFHRVGERVDEVAQRIVAALERRGVRALNPAMGFPMEMDRFGGRTWVVSHKTVAVEAGLGRIGIHRNLIHPRFGNFVLLGTVLLAAEVSDHARELDFNPCLECKLCVAACPVGAIGGDGHFDFSACYTHNYREFMGGFTDWVRTIADSSSGGDYGARVEDRESASMWQSLSYGANYKAAYCLAVCPAGEDVIGPFLTDRADHLQQVVRPLQDKEETVYVVARSDAEEHVARRFPNKRTRRVGNGLNRVPSIASFLRGLPLVFQRERSRGLAATYHFSFTGEERQRATVVIRDRTVAVEEGHVGEADLVVEADSCTWRGFLAGERNLAWALLRRKIKLRGSPRRLLEFGRCFPA